MSNQVSLSVGAFAKSDLLSLVHAGRVVPSANFDESHINEASIDVTFTGECYKVCFLVMPRQAGSETVRSLLPMMGATPHNNRESWKVGETYLAKASIELNLPPGIYGYFNAKSTSGRLFNFVRAFVDGVSGFDVGDLRHQGLSGEVWLVIQPLTFDIMPSVQECYTQLRIFNGDTRFREEDLRELLLSQDLLYRRKNGEAYKQGDLGLFSHAGSVFCTLFAKGKLPIGYVAKKCHEAIDLTCRNIDWRDYFDPVYAAQLISGDETSWGVILEAGRFYLLSTNEVIFIPEACAAELLPLARRNGEVITHYAGYIDPGFKGVVVLEMHAPRTVFLRHKQPIAEFLFEKMRAGDDGKFGGSYNSRGTYAGQVETRLPKQFKQD